jgi:hypothetical protein
MSLYDSIASYNIFEEKYTIDHHQIQSGTKAVLVAKLELQHCFVQICRIIIANIARH